MKNRPKHNEMQLRTYQLDAVNRMKNGCILNGGVGSGKSRTSLAYFYKENGGDIYSQNYVKMTNPKNLYIITTARKRDTLEWEGELIYFRMSTNPEHSLYKNQKVIVDSWNNIKKYTDVTNAFFIFDEQRVVGYGAWTKAFLKITKSNNWILLSATPGDTWMDYVPVFIANGFYRNKTDFCRQHVIFSHFTTYPKVERYINEGILIRYRRSLLINMDYQKQTIQHHEVIITTYNHNDYDYVVRNRWNIFTDSPIQNAGEYCLVLRRLVNTDISRKQAVLDILNKHPKAIIFYSYDYELNVLREMFSGTYKMAEWNGHKHEPLPNGDRWVYLVEYTAGCEGWNCITTDTIIFWSQNYSYKVMLQAAGRIDRMNTPYTDLWYYHLRSSSNIDKAIYMALKKKKKFNETAFAPKDYTEKKPEPYQTKLF